MQGHKVRGSSSNASTPPHGWLSSVILFDARWTCLFHARPLQGPLKYDVDKIWIFCPLPFSAQPSLPYYTPAFTIFPSRCRYHILMLPYIVNACLSPLKALSASWKQDLKTTPSDLKRKKAVEWLRKFKWARCKKFGQRGHLVDEFLLSRG